MARSSGRNAHGGSVSSSVRTSRRNTAYVTRLPVCGRLRLRRASEANRAPAAASGSAQAVVQSSDGEDDVNSTVVIESVPVRVATSKL